MDYLGSNLIQLRVSAGQSSNVKMLHTNFQWVHTQNAQLLKADTRGPGLQETLRHHLLGRPAAIVLLP